METQAERQEKHMKQLAEVHRQKVALLESQFLQQKQQLLRGKAVSSTMVIKSWDGGASPDQTFCDHRVKVLQLFNSKKVLCDVY